MSVFMKAFTPLVDSKLASKYREARSGSPAIAGSGNDCRTGLVQWLSCRVPKG